MKRNTVKEALLSFTREFVKNSNKRPAPCRHYEFCGGCNYQQVPYEEQLDLKLGKFKELIRLVDMEDEFEEANIEIVDSPESLHYRQRVDLAFKESAGFHYGGSKRVIELEECLLMRDGSFEAFIRTRDLARELGLAYYNSMNHTGFLRYITIRQAKDGQRMISLLTKSNENAEVIEKIAQTLLDEKIAVSVHWTVNEGMADVVFGDEYKFWGEEFIIETFHGKNFLLGPNTFFQSNPHMAEIAYGLIRQHVEEKAAKEILDLYSGTCTIGLILSDLAEKLTAVENFPANWPMAKTNLLSNKVEHIDYRHDDVADFMKEYKGNADYLVLNPPRSGVDEKPLRAISKSGAKSISYLSCNPMSLMDDLGILTLRYEIEKVYVLDMFPQTQHFETLVLLKKI